MDLIWVFACTKAATWLDDEFSFDAAHPSKSRWPKPQVGSLSRLRFGFALAFGLGAGRLLEVCPAEQWLQQHL